MDCASSHLKALALNGVTAMAVTLCTGGAALAGSFDGRASQFPALRRATEPSLIIGNCHSACNIDPLSRGIGVQN
jgi:hypothetical protein